jgi:hypothetical protein
VPLSAIREAARLHNKRQWRRVEAGPRNADAKLSKSVELRL